MEWSSYPRFVLALILVIALIGMLAWIARRYGLGGALAPKAGRRRRLGVVEVLALDAKRRLVLVRRDEVEHLILLGVGGDITIEAGIPSGNASFVAALDENVDMHGEPQR